MKKLALALVCLVSVAFFASCNPDILNPEPTIAIKTGEGYISDGATLNVNTEYKLGIMAVSNSQTMKDLANFRLEIKLFSMEGLEVGSYDSTWLVNGSEFEYDEIWSFGEAKDLVGTATITATVTDVAGKFNTLKLNVSINQPAQPLIGNTIEWIRRGGNVEPETETSMAACGMQWDNSYKEVMATLKPLTGATMYICPGDDYATIATDVDKAAYFANLAETATPADKYRNITTNNSADYNDMLAVIYGENMFLIHITHAKVEAIYNGNGDYVRTDITITGEVK